MTVAEERTHFCVEDLAWPQLYKPIVDDITRQNKQADVTIVLSDRELNGHSSVIEAMIPYIFNEFLKDRVNNSEMLRLKLNDVDCNLFNELFKYCYSGDLWLYLDDFQNILFLANFFQMEHLLKLLSLYIGLVLEPGNLTKVYEYLQFAKFNKIHSLTEQLYRFMSQHFLIIINHDQFKKFNPNELGDLLCRDDLNIDNEKQVVEALLSWADYNNPESNPRYELLTRHADVADEEERPCLDFFPNRNLAQYLLKHIRLPLLKLDIIVNQIVLKMYLDDANSKKILNDSFIYHLIEKQRHLVKLNHTVRCFNAPAGYPGYLAVLGNGMIKSKDRGLIEMYSSKRHSWWVFNKSWLPFVKVAAASFSKKLFVLRASANHFFTKIEVLKDNELNFLADLPQPKNAPGFASFKNEYLVICGGGHGNDATANVHMFNTKTRQWQELNPMNSPRVACGAVGYGDNLFVVGGFGKTVYETAECWNSETKQWRQLSDMKNKRYEFGIAVHDNFLYAVGGGTDNINTQSAAERYDIVNDIWDDIRPMHQARRKFGLAAYNSKLYAVGGVCEQKQLSSVEFYSPANDQWTICTQMEILKGNISVAVVEHGEKSNKERR